MVQLALYRKYRSVDFDDVVGQDHITTTLIAALQKGLIAHAYLFAGPRGVGKTSVARIMARRINGLSAQTDITNHLDIIEIDAASNRGIDEIRVLRERITSAPSALNYKVYIIDEVHMLTREAFNALLKTLEEPPSHAIFILATTEAHKLPETIISRTQRFDFRPIKKSDIIARLSYIAKQQKIKITPEALEIIATSAEGGLRDAISLLDQFSTRDGIIDDKLVSSVLGMSSSEQLKKLSKAVLVGELATVNSLLVEILELGVDPVMLTEQLISYFKSMFYDVIDDQASHLSPQRLLVIINRLTTALKDFKLTSQYSLPLELAVYELSLKTFDNTVAAQQPKNSIIKNADTPIDMPINDFKSNYDKALSYIKTKNNSLYAVMNMANAQLKGDQLILDFNFSFHKDRVEETKNRRLIEAVISKIYSRPIELVCRLHAVKEKPVDNSTELVHTAIEILGGEVLDG